MAVPRKLKAYNGMVTRDKTTYRITGIGADMVNLKNIATGEVTSHTYSWICQCLLTRTLKLVTLKDPEQEAVKASISSIAEDLIAERKRLEEKYGQVWDTKQLTDAFQVEGFLAPFCTVTRKTDMVRGSMEFQHRPRFYWGFTPISG